MSMMPPPDNWIPEEPPDLYPPDDDMLARLDSYAPPMPSDEDFYVPDEVYIDIPPDWVEESIPAQGPTPASEAVERDPDWLLEGSGVIIEAIQPDPDADPTGYAVGVVEVWGNPHTGDQSGAYLHMADAPHLERAEEMRRNIYRLADEADVPDHQFGDFAHGLIQGRGAWQHLTETQWNLVDNPPAPDTPDFLDDVLWEARDQMLTQVFEMAADEPRFAPDVAQAMADVGIQIKDFDPASTPPPLFDEGTNTSYWIGVFQNPERPNHTVTSILSIRDDEARLAPVATGDFERAYQTAEYLLKVAERTQDVGQLLDAAEGMAVAAQHREMWNMEVGENLPFSPVGMEIE
jgi:hypothetical protein